MLELTANIHSFIVTAALSDLLGAPFIFPTDTIYGIGATVSNIDGNTSIFQLKRRDMSKGFPVLAANIDQVQSLSVLPKDESVLKRIDYLWSIDYPHSCTLILKAAQSVPAFYAPLGTIAVRLVKSGWLKDALTVTGPVTATSVNFSGEPFLKTVDEIKGNFNWFLLLNGEAGGEASHIYDFTESYSSGRSVEKRIR